MGALGDLVQEFRDGEKGVVSDALIARHIGVTRTTVGNWLRGATFASPEHLRALATFIGVPYGRVLDAALVDAGYYVQPGRELTGAQEQGPGSAPDGPPAGAPSAPAGNAPQRGPKVGPARHGRTRTTGRQTHGST